MTAVIVLAVSFCASAAIGSLLRSVSAYYPAAPDAGIWSSRPDRRVHDISPDALRHPERRRVAAGR